MVRKWLGRCTATHKQCRRTISGDTLDLFDEPRLPTRVIDVGRADGSQVPRLLETQGRKGRYVALSYCWGPPDRHPLRKTKDNLEAHLECLKLESLIKTHQHAIVVTRAIGIKYLWIDSLCTVQDDVVDWERESAVMGFIYERAHLTIAASAAEDSAEGLFIKRSGHRPTVDLPYINKSGQQEGLFTVSGFRVDNGLFPQVQLSALSKRAWATQEWILSRRMVHYMESSIIWTCQEVQQTEMGIPVPIFAMDEDWDGITWMYSRRGIAYPGDRLFALQGIANEMQKGRNDTYVYGMWTGDFPRQLFWMRADKLEKNTAFPHVPSWSWASTTGAVTSSKRQQDWDDLIWHDACRFLYVEPSGMLVLSGRVKPASRFRNIALSDRCPGYSRKDRDVSGLEWPGGLMDDLLPEEPDPETIYLIMNDNDNILGWVVLDVISELNGEPYYLLLGEGVVEAARKDYDDDEEAGEGDVTDDSKSAVNPQEFEETLEEKRNKALCLSIILWRSATEVGAFARIGVGLFGSVMSSWFYSEEAQEIRII